MCGIAGVLGTGVVELRSTLERMADSLRHRGPNDGDTWMDASAGIGLAHRRLSILDLSPHGAQPMISASGRFVLTFNGEVYNHKELRELLDAGSPATWRGHSDTEVLLEAIDRWGVFAALERINGMFAFAVWDRLERKLTLARDRLGEKPLYIGWVGDTLAFASELKALRCLPGWHHEVDRQALALLLRYGYVPAPLSIHPNIFKLSAASFITFSVEDTLVSLSSEEFTSRCQRYWSLAEAAAFGAADPFTGTPMEAADLLQARLAEAVKRRMEADVSVGAMLSGGIDSSLVTALMQQNSLKPVQTFTIGFHERSFNEAPHAQRIARHLGTDHTEFHLESGHALKVIPQLPSIYDEPFADPSQIPTVLVSEIARRHVTVALSGDGGDELFFGYGRYADALRIWNRLGGMSSKQRVLLARFCKIMGSVICRSSKFGFRLARFGRRIDANNFDEFYRNLLSLALPPTTADSNYISHAEVTALPAIPMSLVDPAARMMFVDQSLYLPENILTKVDRASMAASLEVRVPLLDPAIVAFAWRLPNDFRWNGQGGKAILRELLYRYIPRELVDRPKQGFSIPLDAWLRNSLREWMVDLLNPIELRSENYINADTVSKLVADHLAGRANNGYYLWPVLMFQAWQRHYK